MEERREVEERGGAAGPRDRPHPSRGWCSCRLPRRATRWRGWTRARCSNCWQVGWAARGAPRRRRPSGAAAAAVLGFGAAAAARCCPCRVRARGRARRQGCWRLRGWAATCRWRRTRRWRGCLGGGRALAAASASVGGRGGEAAAAAVACRVGRCPPGGRWGEVGERATRRLGRALAAEEGRRQAWAVTAAAAAPALVGIAVALRASVVVASVAAAAAARRLTTQLATRGGCTWATSPPTRPNRRLGASSLPRWSGRAAPRRPALRWCRCTSTWRSGLRLSSSALSPRRSRHFPWTACSCGGSPCGCGDLTTTTRRRFRRASRRPRRSAPPLWALCPRRWPTARTRCLLGASRTICLRITSRSCCARTVRCARSTLSRTPRRAFPRGTRSLSTRRAGPPRPPRVRA